LEYRIKIDAHDGAIPDKAKKVALAWAVNNIGDRRNVRLVIGKCDHNYKPGNFSIPCTADYFISVVEPKSCAEEIYAATEHCDVNKCSYDIEEEMGQLLCW